MRRLLPVGAFLSALVLAGCQAPSVSNPEVPTTSVSLLAPTPASADLTDPAYLHDAIWDDGQAEIAFYQLERTHNQYGQPKPLSIVVGTYLVKHDFDIQAQAKARGDATNAVSGFKWALFYEFESGAYQYKRSYVVNAAQADMQPLKSSLASFDWCSNLYRDLAFMPDGTVDVLMRSDDYGNVAESFTYQAQSYPAAQIPLLIRAFDFSSAQTLDFQIVQADGTYLPAQATLVGQESVETEAGTLPAEKIRISYGGETQAPSILAERASTTEFYWRGTGADRLLLKVQAEDGRYTMTLIENVRSAYWRENFYPNLKRVTVRP